MITANAQSTERVQTIGLLHPGEMGAAIGAALVAGDRRVIWASAGRSPATARRAADAGLEDVGELSSLVQVSDVILSIIPPAEALAVARQLREFRGIYVDANAISPATARAVASTVEAAGGRCVDGGIIGGPPARFDDCRLYLSGPDAGSMAQLFASTVVDARLAGPEVGHASAVKVAFAGWTKGSAALLLALQEFAQHEGVEDVVRAEWLRPLSNLDHELARASHSRATKGWRWTGEMLEIASALHADGLPAGFHQAAAEIYGTAERPSTS